MERAALRFASICLLAFTASAVAAEPQPVPLELARQWIRWTVPLPKEIDITHEVVVEHDRIAIVHPAGDVLIEQAARELRAAISGSPDPLNVVDPQWTVRFRVGGAEADPLQGYPNADQAYLIRSDPVSRTTDLIAQTPRGAYYASKTLQQLIRGRRNGDVVTVPVMTVTDWPDMADRGLWGVDASYHLPWLSDRKLNYMEQLASVWCDGVGQMNCSMADYKQVMLDDGPTYGFNPVPAIPHLNFMESKGVLDAYPDLYARGSNAHPEAACYLRPQIFDVLGGWITCCAGMNNVTEVDVWMTENLGSKTGCRCTDFGCAYGNRDLLELQAVLNGWQQARQQYPDLRLRILSSEETDDSNVEMLAMMPADATFWYYHSLLTYNTRETAIVPDYLQAAAGTGQRVGICPNLSPSVIANIINPFSGAQFVRYRVDEFVSKGLSGVIGYPKPRVFYYAFNVEAAAEWMWNVGGRSAHDFALSRAVREGLADPELFAQWSDLLGPVAWDVYGSAWPVDESRNTLAGVAEQLVSGNLPSLGQVLWGVYPKPWGEIHSARQLDQDVADADQAVAVANQMGVPRFQQESLVVQGYIRSLKALHELKYLVSRGGGIAPEDYFAANRYFQMYVEGLAQARDAVVAWEQTLPPDLTLTTSPMTGPTTALLNTMIAEMTDAVDQCAGDPAKVRPGANGCGVPEQDTDGDGIGDEIDNCPGASNPDQTDHDDDGAGDVCDPDDDNDAVADDGDNCPFIPNGDQADADHDAVGDACDACPRTIPGAAVDTAGCPPKVPGDIDGDGDVDQEDFGRFQACLGDRASPIVDPDCLGGDLNGDSDVDQNDMVVFQGCITGANMPGDPACAD